MGNGNFIMKSRINGSFEWSSLSYSVICDKDGTPVKAIGIQEKLPDISGINGLNRTAWTYDKTYTEIMVNAKGAFFKKSDETAFLKRFDSDHLLEMLEKEKKWSSMSFRKVTPAGEIRWIRDVIDLQRDPKSDEAYMFACFTDVQKRHEWEERLKDAPARRVESGLYDARTARKLTEGLMTKYAETCALAMIRFGSSGNTDPKISEWIQTALAFALGSDCVAGQLDADTVLAFFPNGGSRYDVKRKRP